LKIENDYLPGFLSAANIVLSVGTKPRRGKIVIIDVPYHIMFMNGQE